MKGRRTPPRTPPLVNLDIEALKQALAGSEQGLFLLDIRHDDNCPTIRSQRAEDCTCMVVEHVIRRVGGGRATQ